MSDPALVAVELGRALTGEALPLTSPEPEDLAQELTDLGWGPEQLAALRRQRQEEGKPWPFPVRSEVVKQAGFATFAAQLERARETMGLTGTLPKQRTNRPLTQAELRLAEDRPPHWG